MTRLARLTLRELIRKTRTQFDWWDRVAEYERLERRDYTSDSLLTPWLNYQAERVLRRGNGKLRANYTWPVVHAAHLAKALALARISVIEFGVGGGNGLVALERAAQLIAEIFDVGIDVYGFDSGCGLPMAIDYRDLPHFWKPGSFPMDEQRLRQRLRGARLVVGPIAETVEAFVADKPAPVGFISFDLDYYSSTKQAAKLLDATPAKLMPRIYCYFDDIMGVTFSDFTGERLAMREFNDAHQHRKFSPIHGLRYHLPTHYRDDPWPDQMFIAHIFDHPLYTHYDQLHKESRSRLNELRDE